jgi:hypothetical protein
MWMEFEGVAGMAGCCCRGWRGEPVVVVVVVPDLMELGRAGELVGSSARRRAVTTDCAVGHGGGKGDIETAVTVAVWAR